MKRLTTVLAFLSSVAAFVAVAGGGLTLLAIESFAVEPVCKLALSLLQIVHGVVKIGPYHADTHHACQW